MMTTLSAIVALAHAALLLFAVPVTIPSHEPQARRDAAFADYSKTCAPYVQPFIEYAVSRGRPRNEAIRTAEWGFFMQERMEPGSNTTFASLQLLQARLNQNSYQQDAGARLLRCADEVAIRHTRYGVPGYDRGVGGGSTSQTDLSGAWTGQASGNQVTIVMRSGGFAIAVTGQRRAGQYGDGQFFRSAGSGRYLFTRPDGQLVKAQILGPNMMRVTNPDGWTDVFNRSPKAALSAPVVARPRAIPAPTLSPQQQLRDKAVQSELAQEAETLKRQLAVVQPCKWRPPNEVQDPCASANAGKNIFIIDRILGALEAKRSLVSPSFYQKFKSDWGGWRTSIIRECMSFVSPTTPCSLPGRKAVAHSKEERYWLKGLIVNADPLCEEEECPPLGPVIIVHASDLYGSRRTGKLHPGSFTFGPPMVNGTTWRIDPTVDTEFYRCTVDPTQGVVFGNDDAINEAFAIPSTDVRCSLNEKGQALVAKNSGQ